MASLTTLVVENQFAEMRDGNDMPLVLQFAHRLSSSLREHLKSNATCSFNYFTSSSAFYSKQLGFLPSGRSRHWAKEGARSWFTCPAAFFPFCHFFFFLPKIRGGPGPPGPYLFQQARATCHKNKITVYFESHSSLYTHCNKASIHPSTKAT